MGVFSYHVRRVNRDRPAGLAEQRTQSAASYCRSEDMLRYAAAAARSAFRTALLAGAAVAIGVMAGRGRSRTQMRTVVADLEHARAQAVRHAELLQAILDSSVDGITVVDRAGESLLHNPAAKDILGALDESNSEQWQAHYGIYHPDEGTEYACDDLPLVRALNGQRSEQVPILIRNPASPSGRIISVCAQPLRDPNGQQGAVAVFHDVTALRQREADLTSFAGIVAHDLKSPLTAISGYAEILRNEIEGLPDAAIGLLDRVLTTSARMHQLIGDLLGYASARDSALEMVNFDLRPVVDGIVSERFATRPRLSAAPVPEAQVGPLAVVHADPVMVHQLLDNLIGNALKYTPPGQPARLEITTTPAARPGWVQVEIADRGIGIPDGQHHAIFEDFHRAVPRNDYAGTGLGLAICNRVVTRHGGRIGVQDNPGGGARFWFTLPAAEAEANPDDDPAAPGRPLDRLTASRPLG
jgi:signal transduction histidine kinase